MSDTLKWIAEELLGFEKTGDLNNLIYRHPTRHGAYGVWKIKLDDLQSWHGIGLVVEEMERRGWLVRIVRLYSSEFARTVWGVSFVMNSCPEARLETMYHPTFDFILSEAVFAAARKAVEAGKE